MGSFLKVLFRNLLEGPSTDPFPVGETFTPDRLRGKCVVDPDLCMGCGVCKNVCAAGAIDITPKKDDSGYTITVWRNSCCLCASCRQYCPTGAMSITNDWHHAHAQSEKYDCVEQHTIDYVPCAHCGALIRPLPKKMAEKLYKDNKDIDVETIRNLCPKCRQIEDARAIEGVRDRKAEAIADATAGAAEVKMPATEKAPVEKASDAGAKAGASSQS